MDWLVGDNFNMIVTYVAGGLLNHSYALDRIEGNNPKNIWKTYHTIVLNKFDKNACTLYIHKPTFKYLTHHVVMRFKHEGKRSPHIVL